MRRMMRFATACACVLAATPGIAANRAVKVYAPPAPPAPIAEPVAYSGFYVGVNAGGGASSTSNGFALGGGQFGYNWQFGGLVLGLEADIQGTSAANESVFGTTRARLGYAFGQTLFYGTGGAAYGDRTVGLISADYLSYAYGGGIEQAFGRWSAKLEYLHVGATDADIGRIGLNYRF